jgi:hypothetical protein
LVFGRDTMASFLRDSNEVTVLLGQGNVSLFHDVDGTPVRMKIGEISVVPVSGFKTLGEVATLNGAVVVSTKEGLLRIEGNGPVIDVAKGKTITVTPRISAPQGGGKAPAGGGAGRCCGGGASTALEAGALGAGGLAAILAGVAMSRSGTASTNASAADSAAAAAASAAAAAASAAAAAASAAAAALSQANAAAIAAGCALNSVANSMGKPSPYTPPPGVSCYNSSTW